MVNLQRVEGVIVRLGVPGTKYGEYLVLWSKEFNHSYILRDDVTSQEWDDAFVCEWKEYDVALTQELSGPEGIETRAYNLRKPTIATCDPSTRADQYYTDIHNPRRVNVFTSVEGDLLARPTVKFKDLFTVPPPTVANNSVDGLFIKRANIRAADLRDLQKFKISEFEGVVELEKVTKRNEAQPWRVTQYVFDGKELSIQGWLSKKGFLLRGSRGHGMVPRSQVKIPQDGLRYNPSIAGPPSRFASVANPDPSPLPPPAVILFGAPSEDQMPPTPAFPEKPSSPEPESPMTSPPVPATETSVVTGTTASQSPECRSEDEFLPVRKAATQMPDYPPNDRVIITRIHDNPVPIEVMGLVVHMEGDKWVFYSKYFSNSTRTYVYLDTRLNVHIGRWYRLLVYGDGLPDLIDFSSLTEIKEIDPPTGLHMRVFPRTDDTTLADILIATTGAVVFTGGLYFIFCPILGSLGLPVDAGKRIDFSKLKKTVVELTFDSGGLLVRRFHGPNANIQKLNDPVVPYGIATQEEADSFFCDPFFIPSNCNEDWIKNEPQSDIAVLSTSADLSVNPSIQPPSPNLSRELNELSIDATPQAPPVSRVATPDNAPSSSNHHRSACRALFPREDKSPASHSGLTVEGSRYRIRRNRFCGPIDPIYDITVNLERESIDSTFIIEVMAMIAFVKEDFVVAYCPLKDYDKIVIPWDIIRQSAYVAEGHPVEPGHWTSLHVHPRQPQPFDGASPPQFTHIATSDPEYLGKLCHVNIKDFVDTWEQRCIEGQFQFLMTIDLREKYITVTHLNKDFYIFGTEQQVDVIVPAYRFESLKTMDYPQLVRFWAVRGLFLFKRTLHLVADAEVEVLKDGETVTYLVPYGHPPLKMSRASQVQSVCPPSKKAAAIENSPLPSEGNPLEEEIPSNAQTLEDAHRDPPLDQEDAYSGFSYPDSHSISFSMEESRSEPTCVLKAAFDALSCLDSEDLSIAFLEEGMEDELEYLIGLREAVVHGEASLLSFKLVFDGLT